MATYGYRIKTTRTQSPHGTVIIVHLPLSTRIAQVYQGVDDMGRLMFYAYAMTCISPERQPDVERVPPSYGCRSLEDLEEKLCQPWQS